MQITFQIFAAILTFFAILQKQKWKMMLLYTFSNITYVAMYLAFGRTTSAFICVVAAVRTFIYMLYSYKNLKPQVFWLVFFETAFVITTVITWNDALDLLPLFAILAVGFGSWQDNQSVLRISYMPWNTGTEKRNLSWRIWCFMGS